MARKLRYQPENVCYHVVTRIAHREFFFDDVEKEIVHKLSCNVERFSGVNVIAYAIMSNHLHLLLFIDKPATLRAYEEFGYFHGYKWCSWGAALAGDELRRKGYNFIYDTSSPWVTVEKIHRQQLEHRMAGDTAEQAEKEEAVFTSGAIIGSESFILKIVQIEEEAFPTGHKTPPVDFGIGGVILKTLRNPLILR